MRRTMSVLGVFAGLIALAFLVTVLTAPLAEAQPPSRPGASPAAPSPTIAAGDLPAHQQPRRENAPPSQGPPPRTGPASAFKPLEDPIFGPNYRANTDPQSPNLAQQEPGIAINPTNPLNVVAAAKDEREGPTTKNIWIYTSTDGGVTWLNQRFPVRTPTPQYSSDPVVRFSDDGICYVTVLPYNPCCQWGVDGSATVGVQVARSFDGGITFEAATQVTNNGSADKEWMAIDNFPTSRFYHRVYVAWMDLSANGVFRVTYSTDRGSTWTDSALYQLAYQFPMPVVYPSGDVAVIYHSTESISNIRSTDGGVTWGNPQLVVPVSEPNCPPDNLNCTIWRLNLIPVVAANTDNGNAVMVWADGGEGTATIYYARGTSDGQIWGPPHVLAPPGVANTYQVEPWVEVDERGVFHAIWYDDRDSPDTSIFHIYYSQSTDDGQSWSPAVRISTAQTDLRIGIPSNYALAAGDYINVTASQGNVYAAWTDTRSGTGEDIYVVRGVFGGTPTPTFTGTPPTATNTRTPTFTPTRTHTPTSTPTVCGGGRYILTQGQGTLVPGTVDIGNHCDDCTTQITLPFTYRLYDRDFASVNVSSNGNMQFNTADGSPDNTCLPSQALDFAILPHWDDLRTDVAGNYGIFTSVSGQAPNRVFNVEWRAQLQNRRGDVNFEVRLYEGQTRFDLVYGLITQYGTGATIGVEDNTGVNFTQFECNTGGLGQGLLLTFVLPPCGTPTHTPTGTPPTATSTPTFSPTVCVGNYGYATATATIELGTTDIGNHCDDCTTHVQMPFPIHFYDQQFTEADVSSNGNLQFTTVDPAPFNVCLPSPSMEAALMPHWDDLLTDTGTGCPAGGCGIFTSVSGQAPNRVFNVEWRAVRYSNPAMPVHFEIRLYETQERFDFVYGHVDANGIDATVGVQNDTDRFTQFSCQSASLSEGLLIEWTRQGCPLPVPTSTPVASHTATPCAVSFSDVHPSDYFYAAVQYLYCHEVISGYADGSFRPYNNATRGQMTKIIVLGFGIAIWTPSPSATPTFTDVPPGDPFYAYIETAAHNQIVSGYADGSFRPRNNVTRGQLSKIVVGAAVVANGWQLIDPPAPTFSDVPRGSPFYTYIETAVCHGVISGYADGTFKPGNDATRGQLSKIVYIAIQNQASCPGTP